MKKRKRKIKSKKAKYTSSDELAKYDWDQCIRDQMKQYGNKETAEKVCASIKNKTVRR